MEFPLITVFILTYNRRIDVERCIHSIMIQSYPNLQVLVVDNFSTDSTESFVKSNYPDIKYIRLEKNYGCIRGRNIGIKYAEGKYIFFTDDDGVLHPKAVEEAYNTIIQDDRIGIVGGRVKMFININEIDQTLNLSNEKLYLHNTFHGGVCLHRKSIYTHTGLYPDYYYGAEEQFLSLMALKAGFFVVRNDRVVLWHKKSADNRNMLNELLNRQINSLSNKVILWPLCELFKELFFTFFRNPYQALKYRVGLTYIYRYPIAAFKMFFSTILLRKPVAKKVFRIYKKLKRNHNYIELNSISVNIDNLTSLLNER